MKPRVMSLVFFAWSDPKIFPQSRKETLVKQLQGHGSFMSAVPNFNENTSTKEIFGADISCEQEEIIWGFIAKDENVGIEWAKAMESKASGAIKALQRATEAYRRNLKLFPKPTRSRTPQEWKELCNKYGPDMADDDTDTEDDGY